MKTRKPSFHPASGIVRRFLRPIVGGFAQRKKLRKSAWYNSAVWQMSRVGRRSLPQSGS
jgi:hypothetical protein